MVGGLELAGTVGVGIGEGTFHVPEEFALEEAWGQCAHIHGHHLRVSSGGEGVQFAGQHLLARTILAGDEDVGVRRCHLLHQSPELLHHPTLAPVHCGFLLFGGCFACGTGDGGQRVYQSLVVPRLYHKVCGSFLDAPHGKVDVGVCREQHHGQGGTDVSHLVQPIESLAPVVDTRAKVHIQ